MFGSMVGMLNMGDNPNLEIFGSKPRPAGWLEAAPKLLDLFLLEITGIVFISNADLFLSWFKS